MTTTMDRPHTGTGSPTGDRFRAALSGAIASVGEVRSDATFGLTSTEILDLVRLAEQATAAIGELQARVVAEADAQDLAKQAGCTSTVAWLRSNLRLSGGAAGRLTWIARALDSDRVALTRDAWAAGRVTAEQARVIAEAINRLSADVDPRQLEAAQATLIAQAQELTFDQLCRVANRLIEVVDPETADELLAEQLDNEERRARQQATLRFSRRGDGTTSLYGRLPVLHADMLKTALDAIGSPRRRSAQDGHIAVPGGLGQPPAHRDGCPHKNGVPALGIDSAAVVSGCACQQHGETGFASSPALSPDGDHSAPVPYPNRLGQALMELVEHLPMDKLPQSGGASATVVVTMTLDDLLSGLGTAVLDTGTEITAGNARRLACNALILPMVLDGASAVLDLGMARRLFDRYQRIALAIRDGGCVWRGCSRPPAWCEAHHLKRWSDGGPTDLANGVLVCGFHHRLLHGGEWEARMAHDGVVEIIPPARVDPDRRPMRHERFTRGPAPPERLPD